MAYVIAEPCIGVKDTACIDACPVDCIHPRREELSFKAEQMLYIDPLECVHCGACVPVCPVSAIFSDSGLPDRWLNYEEVNRAYYGHEYFGARQAFYHDGRPWRRQTGSAMKQPGTLVLAFLATLFAVWAGLVFGVSFLSARAKFRAPSITLRVALDVGRQTFRMLSRTELLLAITASLACVGAPTTLIVAGMTLVWSVIAAERLWLLPVLDLRAGIRMTGRTTRPSYHHSLFGRLEITKACLLLVCSGVAILTAVHR